MENDILTVESYWNKQPCNIKYSDKTIGSIEYFNEVEKKRDFVEPHNKTFADYERWKNKKVLEIGCGLGSDAIHFAEHVSHYTGVELSKRSLKIAKKRLEIYNKRGDFYHGNAEEMSTFLPIETYDLIYSSGVIHHSPYPEKIIHEIKKYMNQDSLLKIMLYSKNSWKNYMIEAGLDQPEAQNNCPIAITYTKNEVQNLLKGFEISSIKQCHIFPYKIGPYKEGQYIKQPWFEAMPEELFKILEENLGWHLLITAKLI